MRCAIVDAYGVGKFLPAALRRHGAECIHVRSQSPDIHLQYRPEDFDVDIEHGDDLEVTAAALREHGVGFVVAGAESGVLLADELSAAVGTPGNGMTRPLFRRNKYEMVRAVHAAGLAAADSFASPAVDVMVHWALERDRWPVVLKPVASAGMDNVHFCRSTDDIMAAHRSIMGSSDRYGRHNETVLAQQHLAGDEYFVNTVSRSGVHRIVEIWRYHKQQIDSTHSMISNEHPVPSEDPAARLVGDYALAALDALEISNGAAHTEVMLTDRGPILIECGARLGGAHVPRVVSLCIGTDQVEQLAYAIARPDEFIQHPPEPYRLLTHVCHLSLIIPREGVIPSAEGWAPIRSLDSFLDMVVTQPEGKHIPRTVDLATSPGYVYLSSDNSAQVDEDYERLREFERNGLYDPPASAPGRSARRADRTRR